MSQYYNYARRKQLFLHGGSWCLMNITFSSKNVPIFTIQLGKSVRYPAWLQYKRIQQAIHTLAQANQVLHQGGLRVAEAQTLLLHLYTSNPFLKITPETMAHGQSRQTELSS